MPTAQPRIPVNRGIAWLKRTVLQQGEWIKTHDRQIGDLIERVAGLERGDESTVPKPPPVQVDVRAALAQLELGGVDEEDEPLNYLAALWQLCTLGYIAQPSEPTRPNRRWEAH